MANIIEREDLTPEKVRDLLDYDPATGVFTWRVRVCRRADWGQPGQRAGAIKKRGYREINICGRGYRSGRLAWFFVHGHWPAHEIDHINNDTGDDRLENLRDATPSLNKHNRAAFHKNPTGYKGVRKVDGKYDAALTYGKRTHHLGRYATPEEASAAYMEKAREVFGENARAR